MPSKSLNERAEYDRGYVEGYRLGQKDFAEKAKAEIEQCKEKGISEFKVCYWDYVRAIDTVLSIIDNIGKGVSE